MKIKIKKLHEDAVIPSYSKAGDAGMDRKITENIAGNWYGDKGDGATKKVERASCTIMKLGTNTLWVHTSYPTNFID